MKTVRFTHVVKQCGRPRVHTLWVAPERDAELTRARKTDRVMTIEAGGRGGKTDTGFVGFHPKKLGDQGQVLIFPKALKAFEGARVVGIKFELVEQPKMVRATPAKAKPRKTPPRRTHPRFQISAKPAGHGASERAEPEETPLFTGRRPPQRERPPPKTPAPPRAEAPAPKPAPQPRDSALLREVEAAIEELDQGKAVAAYKRLQRAVAEERDRAE